MRRKGWKRSLKRIEKYEPHEGQAGRSKGIRAQTAIVDADGSVEERDFVKEGLRNISVADHGHVCGGAVIRSIGQYAIEALIKGQMKE